MIGDRKVLAVIPARGGSKGVPGKNVARVGGRPLLDWTIRAAHASPSLDRVVVSSDDAAILSVAYEAGCETLVRPPELATDTADAVDVTLHALDVLAGYAVVVLLQPTSPLRTSDDIEGAIALFAARGAVTCVSVCPVEQTPYWMYRLASDDTLASIVATPPGVTRRQDLPAVFLLNGAIYVADAAALRASRTFVDAGTLGYVMPGERSLDVDTAADLERVRDAVRVTTMASK